MPEGFCSTGTSSAQGQQQQFECIGFSLSSFVSFAASTLPLPLLSLSLSAWPSTFICLKTATINHPQSSLPSPLLATGVTALLEVQNPLTGVRKKHDVQRRIEWADSFICSSTHKLKKGPVFYFYIFSPSTPPSHSLLLHLLCGGFGES